MSDQSNNKDKKTGDTKHLTPLYLPGETMQQSFDRIERQAQRLGVHPDSLLTYGPRPQANSATHPPDQFHLRSGPQANHSTTSFDITFNPQYRNGTGGSGQSSSSAQQASHGSGATTSDGNASRQSNAGAQRDNSGSNSASPNAQNTRASTWNGHDQSGGANSRR